MLFNRDMDQRLTHLQSAVTTGGAITAQYQSRFQGQHQDVPARIMVDIEGTERRLVFAVPIAESVAGQLEANGLADAAGVIRAAIPTP